MIQIQAHTTELGRLIVKDPSAAAERIEAMLTRLPEAKAASELGVSLRTLRRYRRRLEDDGLLARGITPRGPRQAPTKKRGNWAGGRPSKAL